MALNMYRRYASHCPGGRALREMTYDADELRRNGRRCPCPIYAERLLRRCWAIRPKQQLLNFLEFQPERR